MMSKSATPAVAVAVPGRGGAGGRRRRRTSSLRTAAAATAVVAVASAAAASAGGRGAANVAATAATNGSSSSPRSASPSTARAGGGTSTTAACSAGARRWLPRRGRWCGCGVSSPSTRTGRPCCCCEEGGDGDGDGGDALFNDSGAFHLPFAFVRPALPLPSTGGWRRACELPCPLAVVGTEGERRHPSGHQLSMLPPPSSLWRAWDDSSSLSLPSGTGQLCPLGASRLLGMPPGCGIWREGGVVSSSTSTSTSLRSLSSSSSSGDADAGKGAKSRPLRKGGRRRNGPPSSSSSSSNVRSDASESTPRRRGAREALKETSAAGKYDASRLPKNINRRERTGRRRSAAASAPDATNNLPGKNGGRGRGSGGGGAGGGDAYPFRYDPSVATDAPPYNPVNGRFGGGGGADIAANDNSDSLRPLPTMPSHQFVALAQSQFDLLANSLPPQPPPLLHGQTGVGGVGGASKAKSMALYLPRENVRTGQLEFVPAVTHPPPDAQQRVFIASDADAKRPPQIPRRLTRLPGFARAKSLLPRYPFAAPPVEDDAGIGGGGGGGVSGFPVDPHDDETACGCGPVEQVTCDEMLGGRGGAAGAGAGASEQCPILSVALYRGSSTVGVLLVWPSDPHPSPAISTSLPPHPSSCWTDAELKQVWRAAYGLSMALSMDRTSSSSDGYDRPPFPVGVSAARAADRERENEERIRLHDHKVRTDRLRTALADNLHQVKNPLQALGTYARLLQRKLAQEDFFQQQRLSTGAAGGGGGGEETAGGGGGGGTDRLAGEEVNWAPLRSLAENVLVQSDRVADRLGPMDEVVAAMEGLGVQQPPALPEVTSASASSLSLYAPPPGGEDRTASSGPAPGSTAGMAAARNGTATPTGAREGALGRNRNPPAIFSPQAGDAGTNAQGAGADAVWFGPPPTTTIKATPEANTSKAMAGSWSPSSPSVVASAAANLPESPHVGDLEVEMAFVPDVVEPILSASAAVASERGVSFDVVGAGEELPGARICPKSLQEALANVVDNAIKYSVVRRGGDDKATALLNPRPMVRVSLHPNRKPHGPGVTILVEDNGPGIPASERGAVFERGYRGEVTRDIRGQGIGLGISRALIGRMGGTLEIMDNDPARGDLSGAVMRFMLFRDVV